MSAELPPWIAEPVLRPAWAVIRRRFEAQGLSPHGRVRVPTATRAERHAVGGLVGRTVTRDTVVVDLSALDERLRQRSGIGGLAPVLTALFGDDLRDRPALRAARLEARERPLQLAAELVDQPWTADWVAGMRSAGLLTGRAEADQVVRQAAAILDALLPAREQTSLGGNAARGRSEEPVASTAQPEEPPSKGATPRRDPPGGATGPATCSEGRHCDDPGAQRWNDSPDLLGAFQERTWSRVELGARLAGDAHALDQDRLLHHVVLRGLAAALGAPLPEGAAQREALWGGFGVEPDLLSRTCLVWGWEPDGSSPVEARLATAARGGDPIHVTAWDLRRLRPSAFAGPGRVLVCENPRVIEAIAEASAQAWTLICTSGEPNLVVGAVLAGFAEAGAELRYHGDFDWPGIAIANRVVARFGARPLLMSAEDYLAALRSDGRPLLGAEVDASWDPELAAAMRFHGRAVHEESVLEALLSAITQ